jgi:hypothetical protein
MQSPDVQLKHERAYLDRLKAQSERGADVSAQLGAACARHRQLAAHFGEKGQAALAEGHRRLEQLARELQSRPHLGDIDGPPSTQSEPPSTGLGL